MELFYTQNIKGDTLYLEGDEANHCANVLRKKIGDRIFVIDGVGGLYHCEISSIESGKKQRKFATTIEGRIEKKLNGAGKKNYHLTMAVCPTKNQERFEWFVEKSTEVGVDKIVPIISKHSVRTSIKKERIFNIALSATKQSLKSYIPEIEDVVSVDTFINNTLNNTLTNTPNPNNTPNNNNALNKYDLLLIAHCEEGEKVTIREALTKYLKDKPKHFRPKIAIMIGPEGDFTKEEIALAQKANFKPITLGNSRLRVETAALATVFEIYFGVRDNRE